MTPEEIKEAIEKLDLLWKTFKNEEAKELAFELLEQQKIIDDVESKAKVYNRLGTVYLKLSDNSNALEYFNKALLLNEEIGNVNGLATNLRNIGITYKNLSEFPKAIKFYEKSLRLYEEIENLQDVATCHASIGIVYYILSDYSKSLECFEIALQINEKNENIEGVSANLADIGNVYLRIADFQKALEYNFKSLYNFEKLGKKFGIAGNLTNIGLVYSNLKDYNNALVFYEKALIIFEEMSYNSGIAAILLNIGSVYKEIPQPSKAIEFYLKALEINEEIGNKSRLAENYGNLGVLYSSKESSFYNVDIAEEYLQKTLFLSLEIGAKDIIRLAYEQLHILRLNEGLFEEALEFYKKSIEIEKEIQSDEAKNTALLFDQRRKLEEDEKARQLKLVRFQEQEKILHNILPIKIADRILVKETFISDHFESVSVMFMDIVGFTSLSSSAPPKQLVYLLDTIFTKADEIVESFGLEKIKTIGDGYLAVANVNTPLEQHQKATAQAALQLLETMKDFTVNIPSDLGDTDWSKDMNELEIRIGIHSGEVVAGIIGKNKYTYDLWGDAVNVASRMESNSEAGCIHISGEFAKSIESNPEFKLIPRGEINIKGKGTMNTFWLEKTC